MAGSALTARPFLTHKSISIRIFQAISAWIRTLKDRGFGVKFMQKARTGRFELAAMIFMAVVVLVMRGTAGEGQASIFSNIVREYIEESSVSLGSIIHAAQVKDVNSLLDPGAQMPGQGGVGVPGTTPLEASTIHENSIVAYAPPSEDYLATTATSQRSDVIEYTVQEGDLLSFIATDYGVSVDSLMWANGIRNADSLKPDQILKIPPVSGVIHTVAKGDTVGSLAGKYGGDENKIIEFNSLPKDGQLAIGDEIMIPGGKPKVVAVASAKTPASSAGTSKLFSYLPDLGSFFMLPTNGFNWGKIHGRNGVDIANSCGTTIYAAADGNVITADDTGWNGGFGKYVKITHANGTETVYAHASKLKVATGDTVSKGQVIMLMGTTGRSTGCHLHFEVHGAKNPLVKK